MGKKSELDIVKENVRTLVGITNDKVRELGNRAFCISSLIETIQSQFNLIRNCQEETTVKCQQIKGITDKYQKEVKLIEDNYNKCLQANVGGGAAGVALGAGVVSLGPSAAMGLATTFGVASTGTAISSLSGAAATNAALAWLGGGALSAGGGGMLAGNALLALAGPVGWTIAGLAFFGTGVMLWKTFSDKSKLERIFLDVSKREQASYELAIKEIDQRISRLDFYIKSLKQAIVKTGTFGLDFPTMTEAQQYALGTYVNITLDATKLILEPISQLQPKITEAVYYRFVAEKRLEDIPDYSVYKRLLFYFAGMLYKIKCDRSDFELLIKSLKKEKDFCDSMKLNKDDLDVVPYEDVVRIISIAKQ